jgi:chlorophyll(ide) b reductase
MPTPCPRAGCAGIAQAWAELRAETAPLGVHVHNLSPGMVITDLLLEGATPASKRVFNVLCELPETAAAFLVPRARNVVATARSARYVRFLTPLRALGRLLAAPLRMHRFFDAAGRPTYESERERVLGRRAKRTERLAARRRRRSAPLGLAYSMSLAASYLLMAMHASAQPPW